jgi:hypothetical protein
MTNSQKFLAALLLAGATVSSGALVASDVCIYGSTPSGIAAAVQAARLGKSVVIVTPDKHLGGMSSSGLGFADSVGMGSYTIDSHNVQRYITPEGYVQNEGDIGVSTKGPYQIAYGALVPKWEQADNLFVTSCLSSSHIAFGSIRMEPVLMILGQSAATAAVLAIEDKIPVQDVPYEKLRKQLLRDGQLLEYPPRGGNR